MDGSAQRGKHATQRDRYTEKESRGAGTLYC
jgi:hypothetical protein